MERNYPGENDGEPREKAKAVIDDQEYMKIRVDNQIKWYSKKSQQNQKAYRFIRLFEIIFSAGIPFIVGFADIRIDLVRWSVALIGVLLAISVGIISLYKFQEKWVAYRTTCETLKHHKYKYITKTTPYDGDDALSAFVENVETLISAENTNWADTIRSKKQEDKNGSDKAN